MSGVDEAAVGRRFMSPEKFHRENHYGGRDVPLAACWYCQRNRAVCRSKIVYDHPRDALVAAMEINVRQGWSKPVAGYQCRECKRWHLTSKSNKTRRRRWRKQMRKAGLATAPASPPHPQPPACGANEEKLK